MLTAREKLVLDLISRGTPYDKVGITLGHSERTAKSTMARIRIKLGAKNTAEAVRIGLERGIILLDKTAGLGSRSYDKLLSTKQAARLLNIHPNTIRRYELEGKVPAFRLGPRRDRRYLRADVLGLLESRP